MRCIMCLPCSLFHAQTYLIAVALSVSFVTGHHTAGAPRIIARDTMKGSYMMLMTIELSISSCVQLTGKVGLAICVHVIGRAAGGKVKWAHAYFAFSRSFLRCLKFRCATLFLSRSPVLFLTLRPRCGRPSCSPLLLARAPCPSECAAYSPWSARPPELLSPLCEPLCWLFRGSLVTGSGVRDSSSRTAASCGCYTQRFRVASSTWHAVVAQEAGNISPSSALSSAPAAGQ